MRHEKPDQENPRFLMMQPLLEPGTIFEPEKIVFLFSLIRQ